MSSDRTSKNRSHTDFWRACRFLAPYRAIVIISILCAFFVGFATTSGLGAMVPILRILLNGDTVNGWMDRQVAEKRLGASLTDDLAQPRLLFIQSGGAAEKAGLKKGELLPPVATLANPTLTETTVRHGNQDLTLPLSPIAWYLNLGRDVATHVPSDPVKAVAIMLGIILTLTVLSNFVRFFQEYLSDKATIGAVNDLRRRLYDHVLHLPLEFFNLKGTSDVTSRLVADTQGLQEGFKIIFGQSIPEIIKASMALGAAVFINWQLTLFIVLFAPIMGVVIKKLGKKMRRAARAAMQNSSSMLGQIEATLSGIRVVKGAVAERFERRRYMGIMGLLRLEQLKMARYEAFSTPTVETITMVVISLIILFATYLVTIVHNLKPEHLIALLGCLAIIGESLRRVSKLNNVIQRSSSAATRVFEILDVPIERRRSPQLVQSTGQLPIKLTPIQREIRFENLTFTYPGGSNPALIDVNLCVPKGKSIAVVGRNGSGKTTLLALLPRFYDPQQGRILVDGIDIRNATLRSLRQQISIVTQETIIFPGTIAQNIAYGLPLASRGDIESAAQRAFAHDFILEKPQGYDTPLEGLGAQLSGGQKQRLCIARAILRQAPILILDEATSQVDAESEHLIQQAIEALMHQRTTFVIAHRFSTILSADEIVVMDKGQIVGAGKHDQLLKTCETYQQLYERQLIAAPVA